MTFEEFKSYSDEGYICLYDNESINEVTTDEIYLNYSSEVKKEDFDGEYAKVFYIHDELRWELDIQDLLKLLNKIKKDTTNFENDKGKTFTLLFREGVFINSEELIEYFDVMTLTDNISNLDIYLVKRVNC